MVACVAKPGSRRLITTHAFSGKSAWQPPCGQTRTTAAQRRYNIVLAGQLLHCLVSYVGFCAADQGWRRVVVGLGNVRRLLRKGCAPMNRSSARHNIAALGANPNLSAGIAFTAPIISNSIRLNVKARAGRPVFVAAVPAGGTSARVLHLCRAPATLRQQTQAAFPICIVNLLKVSTKRQLIS